MAEPLPDLTIVIPTYNRARLVSRAIASCLSDISQNIEVIVVDDCSTDDTAESLSAFRDMRLLPLQQSVNRGVCAARRLGVFHARAPWLAFLDSDDELAPGAVEGLIRLLQTIPPDVSTVYTQRKHDDGLISPSHVKHFGRLSYTDYIDLISGNYRKNCDVFTCVRRSALAFANWPAERVPEIGFHLDLARATGTMILPDIFYLNHDDAGDRLTSASRAHSTLEEDLAVSRYCLDVLDRHGMALRKHGSVLWNAIAQRSIVLCLQHGQRAEAQEALRIANAQCGFSPRLTAIYAIGSLGTPAVDFMRAVWRKWKGGWDAIARVTSLKEVFSSAGTLGMGAALAQAITMLASPILSRVFSPGQIGAFGVYLGLVMLFTASPSLNFQQCILLERDDEGVETAVSTSLFVNAILVGAFLLALSLFYSSLSRALPPNVAPMLTFLAPFSIAAAGAYTINQFLNLRSGAIRALANYQVSRAALTAVLQIGSRSLGALGLALGQLLGQAIGLVGLSWTNRPIFRRAIKRLGDVRAIIAFASRYKSFALFGAPQSILNALSGGFPAVIISALYGPSQAGFFWLAYRVFGLPNQIVAESLRGAFYQSMARARRDDHGMIQQLARGTGLCAFACAIFALPVLAAGPWLFAFVFGANWREAGLFAEIAAGAWLLQNASIPATIVLTLYQRQAIYLALEVAGTALKLGAFAIAAHAPDATLGVILYSIAGALQAIVIMIYAAVLVRPRMPEIRKAEAG